MFLEQSYTVNDKSNIPYTLRDEDHPEGYLSLSKLYLAEEDPTELIFARKYLDGYEHWLMLCSCEWFIPYLERWRKELDLQIKSRAIASIKVIASDDSHRNQFEAIKTLLNAPWKVKEAGAGRGRPSKEEIAGALKEAATEEATLQAESERVLGKR